MTEKPDTTDRIAFFGAGVMGLPMARNLATAGRSLRVWNRSIDKARPLAEHGAQVEPDANAAAHGADVLVTMLYDADSVAAAVEGGVLDGLAPGAVWVQMTTVGVEGTDRLAALAAGAGVTYVDAPVLGTRTPAEKGALVILASGPDEAVSRVSAVLEPVGRVLPGVGAVGQGSRLKLVANSWVLTLTDGVANAVSLARALGVDPGLFLDAIDGGAVDSPYAHLKGGAMIENDYAVSFTLDGAAKDAELIRSAARAAGADSALVEAILGHLRAASARGFGEQDMAAVVEAYRG